MSQVRMLCMGIDGRKYQMYVVPNSGRGKL